MLFLAVNHRAYSFCCCLLPSSWSLACGYSLPVTFAWPRRLAKVAGTEYPRTNHQMEGNRQQQELYARRLTARKSTGNPSLAVLGRTQQVVGPPLRAERFQGGCQGSQLKRLQEHIQRNFHD